jgi:hypothetical protein
MGLPTESILTFSFMAITKHTRVHSVWWRTKKCSIFLWKVVYMSTITNMIIQDVHKWLPWFQLAIIFNNETKWIYFVQVNLSFISGGLFPHGALNIRCTVTRDFVSANHRTHLAYSCTEAIYKKNQQQRSWWQKQYTEETTVETLWVPKFSSNKIYSFSFNGKIL